MAVTSTPRSPTIRPPKVQAIRLGTNHQPRPSSGNVPMRRARRSDLAHYLNLFVDTIKRNTAMQEPPEEQFSAQSSPHDTYAFR